MVDEARHPLRATADGGGSLGASGRRAGPRIRPAMRDAEDGDVGVEPGQVGLDRRSEEAGLRWVRAHEPERSSGRAGP